MSTPSKKSDTDARYQHEREFWDHHASKVLAGPVPSVGTFAELAKTITYLQPVVEFFGSLEGRRVLDLACGDGWISLGMAKAGAEVYGCDISPKLIELAKRIATHNHLDARTHFDVMPCEELTYDDASFDFIIMHAALHHCDIRKTCEQASRVLRSGGKAVFIEDYAYHPAMKLYRRLTPHQHTETEEALTDEDLGLLVSFFSSHEFRYHGLLNLVETHTQPWLRFIRPLLRQTDALLYHHIPRVSRYSKLIEIFVVK